MPTDGQDISINDSMKGHEAAVADKQPSLSLLQKEASRDVNIGQLMNASDSPPHPFYSS